MEPLLIEGSKKTPLVNFDPGAGKLLIQGRSIPENAAFFFNPLVKWLAQYMENPQEATEFNIHLDYFNTSSSKCMTDMFRVIETLHKAGHKVIINWYYSDEYMFEAGEDFSSILDIPINMIETPE
ncbi:MAG: DUF1987 domain-containing protein [Bacteroidia bacterium]|nr:DUF1987 domain-containing protein [Bacteroidia bacterium]